MLAVFEIYTEQDVLIKSDKGYAKDGITGR